MRFESLRRGHPAADCVGETITGWTITGRAGAYNGSSLWHGVHTCGAKKVISRAELMIRKAKGYVYCAECYKSRPMTDRIRVFQADTVWGSAILLRYIGGPKREWETRCNRCGALALRGEDALRASRNIGATKCGKCKYWKDNDERLA